MENNDGIYRVTVSCAKECAAHELDFAMTEGWRVLDALCERLGCRLIRDYRGVGTGYDWVFDTRSKDEADRVFEALCETAKAERLCFPLDWGVRRERQEKCWECEDLNALPESFPEKIYCDHCGSPINPLIAPLH